MPPTNEDRAARLARAIRAAISGDGSPVHDLFTRDVIASGPGMQVASRDELVGELSRRLQAFSERKVAISALDVAGAQACVEWVASGIHTRPFEIGGATPVVIEPTGRRVRLRAITVADFEGDQICSLRSYWDDAGLLNALGILSAD